MDLGTSNWVLILNFLMCFVTFSNEKAVPEDSIRGYEYTYNNQNGQYEVRPLYGKQILLTSTLKPEHRNPQTEFFENRGKPIFLPPLGKPKGEMNKILNDYYSSKSKLNQQFKGMDASRDYSNNFDFTENWSPEYFTNDGYDNGYFENPIISSSKNSHDKSYQNKESCKNCHVKLINGKSERYKIEQSDEYEDGSKLQSNRNHGLDQFRRKGDKIHSRTVQSSVSTDYPDKPTYEFEHVNVVNRMQSNDKSALTETTLEEKYYTPAIQVSLRKKSGSKGNHKKIKKNKNYGDFKVKLLNSESVKLSNKRPEPVSTITKHTTESPVFKETKTTPLPEMSKGYDVKTIPVEQTKQMEDHEIDHFTEVKDAHSSSFTKKKKECKDMKLKSNKNGHEKSCSENSNSSEPEMEASPKTPSIETSSVKSPIIDEYDLKNKGNESNLKYSSVIEDISKGIGLMDIEESHGDFRRDISECSEKFIEPINSGDMETNRLNGQCPENDVATDLILDDPNFSEMDNKFKSFSFLNSNLWSLISNPNAKDLALQKCITRKNESGHCMYIQNCPVPNIANSLEQLLNNACVMDEVFIGICCPEFPVETVKVHWEQLESNSSEKQTEDEFRHDVEDCGKRSEEASKRNLWPWKAPLVSMSNGKIFCGGVIISERYVLTAAHCTTKIAKNQILVRLGQDHESLGKDVPVIEIKRHAQYNPRTMQHDIALLKLDKRLSHAVKGSTSMICLPDESDSTDSHAGDKAILLGWQGLSGVNPQKAETLEILSNEECRKKLNANVHQSLLCTEVRNEDERTCNADSGAPLVIEDDDDQEYEVVGILSWNRNDCDPRFPSTFSRVSSYRGWIRRHAV